jgi:hypothetical protein
MYTHRIKCTETNIQRKPSRGGAKLLGGQHKTCLGRVWALVSRGGCAGAFTSAMALRRVVQECSCSQGAAAGASASRRLCMGYRTGLARRCLHRAGDGRVYVHITRWHSYWLRQGGCENSGGGGIRFALPGCSHRAGGCAFAARCAACLGLSAVAAGQGRDICIAPLVRGLRGCSSRGVCIRWRRWAWRSAGLRGCSSWGCMVPFIGGSI